MPKIDTQPSPAPPAPPASPAPLANPANPVQNPDFASNHKLCAGGRGVYLFRKPNIQLNHFLARLICSCNAIRQEGEFLVVRIEINHFS